MIFYLKIVERIPEENSIAKNMMINFTNTVKMLKDNEISLEVGHLIEKKQHEFVFVLA
jgi:hypothetical protein